MAPKTVPTDIDPIDFIKTADPKRVEEGLILHALLAEITGEKAVMWGPTIIGFGSYIADAKNNVTWPLIGFSPRKAELVLYIMPGFDLYQTKLQALGPHRTGSSCLYIKKLSAVSLDTLKDIMADSYQSMKNRHELSGK